MVQLVFHIRHLNICRERIENNFFPVKVSFFLLHALFGLLLDHCSY